MKLIDKDALVAEIERRIKEIEEMGTPLSPKGTLTNLLCHINTLEVKEVDLDLEITLWANAIPEIRLDDVERLAKYFFELGMRASNPITASDRGTAEEIIISLKQVENDYRIDHTKEIEWVRNKVKKGE